MLEQRHGLDVLVQHDQLAGLGIHTGAHQLGGGGNHRVALARVNEVVQLHLALGVVAGDLHHVLGVVFADVGIGIRQGLAHAAGVVNVFTKDDGFVVAVGGLEVLGDLGGHQLVALFQHQLAVHVGGVVDPVFNDLAQLVGHARCGAPAKGVFVQVDADNLVGGQVAVFNALLEGVGVNRLAKVLGVGGVPGLLGRGRQADLGGAGKVAQNFTPGGVFVGTAPVAFVHHDEVEKVWRELLVDVLLFFRARHGLVEREVNLVRLVHQLGRFVDGHVQLLDKVLARGRIDPLHALGIGAELGHGALERPKVVDHGLVDEDVAVGQKEDALLARRLVGLPG